MSPPRGLHVRAAGAVLGPAALDRPGGALAGHVLAGGVDELHAAARARRRAVAVVGVDPLAGVIVVLHLAELGVDRHVGGGAQAGVAVVRRLPTSGSLFSGSRGGAGSVLRASQSSVKSPLPKPSMGRPAASTAAVCVTRQHHRERAVAQRLVAALELVAVLVLAHLGDRHLPGDRFSAIGPGAPHRRVSRRPWWAERLTTAFTRISTSAPPPLTTPLTGARELQEVGGLALLERLRLTPRPVSACPPAAGTAIFTVSCAGHAVAELVGLVHRLAADPRARASEDRPKRPKARKGVSSACLLSPNQTQPSVKNRKR